MKTKFCWVAILLALGGFVSAQDVGSMPKTNPAFYALTGATIVVGNGQTIEGGTVVIRDGIIQSVGSGAPPAGARVIEMNGMFIYPGLIDALAEIGGAAPAAGRGGRGGFGGGGGQAAPNSQEGPGYFAHVSAANLLETQSPGDVQGWRRAAVLTRHVSPPDGIFKGTTAIIDLNGEESDAMLVQGDVAMAASYQGAGFDTYPGSLMGVIAHIRQTLSDAVHYREAWAIYESNRKGLMRPETDLTLQALQPVISGKMPIIFPAQRDREIRRSIKMCQDFNTRCLVAGGFEADQAVDVLKSSGTPVLLSLNFPRKPRDQNPQAEEDTSVIRYRVHAPAVAAGLQEAGVKFAFYSDGASPDDFLPALRRIVSRGLGRADALRAASLSAAEILGVSDVLGSVERGKIANLVVTDKDIFEDDAAVRHTFVDGLHFVVPKASERRGESEGRRGTGSGSAAADLTGIWDVQVMLPDGSMQVRFDLSQQERQLTGQVSSQLGTVPIREGQVRGNRFSFWMTVNMGGTPADISIEGAAAGDRFEGTASGPEGSAPIEGSRRPGV